ncbi:MAG: Ribosomal silencing factor RsfS [Chlamydiales bacterium]|nr:Ribosomal silencing factor RsfS [Chlamydiales bacterium]
MKKDPLLFLNAIAQALFDKKGINIMALDVQGVSTLTDYFVIAEGNVDKHVIGLAKTVIETLKNEGETPLHVEGLHQGDWVVIDYLELVIHLFKPGIREKYRLEELWNEGKVVDLDLTVPQARTI